MTIKEHFEGILFYINLLGNKRTSKNKYANQVKELERGTEQIQKKKKQEGSKQHQQQKIVKISKSKILWKY